MKSPNPSHKKFTAPCFGALAIGASLLAFAPNQASATLTFDLRAVSATNGGVLVTPKEVVAVPGSIVAFDVWAQITAATTGVTGLQNVTFSILSSNGGSVRGNMGVFVPFAPWDSLPTAGTAQDLDADGDADLGSNLTTTLTGLAKGRSDNTAAGGGDPAFGNGQTTAVHAPAANFVPVTNAAGSGFEVLLGRVTFTMTGFGAGDPSIATPINARPGPQLLTGGTKATSAQFVEAGVLKSGATGVFAIGAPLLISVPEPSAFGMVILGAMGIVGMRRAGIRRS